MATEAEVSCAKSNVHSLTHVNRQNGQLEHGIMPSDHVLDKLADSFDIHRTVHEPIACAVHAAQRQLSARHSSIWDPPDADTNICVQGRTRICTCSAGRRCTKHSRQSCPQMYNSDLAHQRPSASNFLSIGSHLPVIISQCSCQVSSNWQQTALAVLYTIYHLLQIISYRLLLIWHPAKISRGLYVL